MFALSLLFAVSLAVPATDYHLDFDNLPGYAVPEEWQLDGWGYDAGYRSKLTGEFAHSGQSCLSLYYEGDAEPSGNGRAYMQLESGDFRGKRVAVRAAVRVVDAGCSAELRLQGRTQSQREVLITGTLGELIRDSEWREFELIGHVGKEIEQLELSFLHTGRGMVLVDDIELVVLDELPSFELQPAKSLEERAVKNFIVLGRVLGYLQYFHPSDQARAADWARYARTGVLAVEEADDSNELCELLERHFLPVAPTLRLFPKGKRPKDKSEFLEPPASTDGISILRWTHTGPGEAGEPYSSALEREPFEGKVPRGWAKPEKSMDFDAGAFVIARVPTTLYADEAGTLPHDADIEALGAVPPAGEAGWTGQDRATRIAAVLMAWNAIQHFGPLIDEAKVDWEPALERAIAEAGEDATEEEFLTTLRQMVATLRDGQAHVEHGSDWRVTNIPICWDWIEDKLVITRSSKKENSDIGVVPGDVILQIGSRSAEDLYRETCEPFAGLSERKASALALFAMRRRAGNEPVKMRVNSVKGRSFDVDYTDTFSRAPMPELRPAQYSELKSGVVYVNLARVSEAALPELVAKLGSAKAVVFDLRDGAASGLHRTLLGHFLRKSMKDVEWKLPISTRPNRDKLDWQELGGKLEPLEPRIEAKPVFISDGRVSGEAEVLLALAANAKLGAIVGERSAGAIGLTAELELPGGYRLTWTASLAELPGGDSLLGEGVPATIPAERTIAGVTAGKDELLEAALAAIEK